MHHRKVREGVTEVMGGQILELECVKQWNAGKAEGQVRVSELFRMLLSQNRLEELARAANDMAYQEELLREMGI